MCGIIGVIRFDSAPAAPEAYTGLLALQHRGQDSAGIACFDGMRVNLKKGVGLVTQVFTAQNLSLLRGETAIGHTRYCTVGSDPKNDAQPFTVSVPHALAMVHNGNIVNYAGLRKKYERNIESSCDVEIILQVFAESITKHRKLYGNPLTSESVFEALTEVARAVNGAYSSVALIENEGLLAFRDALGIKPLVMGTQKDAKGKVVAVAFASESVSFDAMGFKLERDIKPGEAVIVSPSGKIVSKIFAAEKKCAHCMFEYVYFARPDSVIDGRSVYEARLALGRELGAECAKQGCAFDVVIPVPDTSRAASQALAESLGVQSREGLIKNRYVARTFIMPTQAAREDAVRVNLNVIDSVVAGKNVALVDDSIVRGTTSKKIIALVKRHAKRVHFFSTCPPLVSPCFYGIDFPTKNELIASGKTIEQIMREMGADELTYQTIEGLRKAIDVQGLCAACLTGEYPTRVTDKDMKEFAALRERERRNKTHFSRVKAKIGKDEIYLD